MADAVSELVIALPAGEDAAEDEAVLAAAAALQGKSAARGRASTVVVVPPRAAALDGALAGAGALTRLVLVGIADPGGMRVGGRGPEALAALLSASGLRQAGRISLVAAGAAAPADAPSDASFAARLHGALRRSHDVATELTARTGDVVVVTEGPDRGRKRTRDSAADPWGAKRPHSKVVYGWSQGVQTRRWAEQA